MYIPCILYTYKLIIGGEYLGKLKSVQPKFSPAINDLDFAWHTSQSQ